MEQLNESDKEADKESAFHPKQLLTLKQEVQVTSNDKDSILQYLPRVKEAISSKRKCDSKFNKTKSKIGKAELKQIMNHMLRNEDVLDMVQKTMHKENEDEPKPSCSSIKERKKKGKRCDHTYSIKVDEESYNENSLLIVPSTNKNPHTVTSVPVFEESLGEEKPLIIALPEDESLQTGGSNTELSMIDNGDDDEWNKFLFELTQPLDTIVKLQKSDDPEDPNDPEFIPFEDDDVDEDFCNDDIPQEEVRESDALDVLASKFYSSDEYLMMSKKEQKQKKSERLDTVVNTNICQSDKRMIVYETAPSCSSTENQQMSFEQKLQLDKQMRQHIQLLTQNYLLSLGHSDLSSFNASCKESLEEIKMMGQQSSKGRNSAFNSYNIEGAINIVNQFENSEIRTNLQKVSKGIPDIVKKTLFECDVFMYPELLPTTSFNKADTRMKRNFTKIEDHLIAIGLQKYANCSSPEYYISQEMIPGRTPKQIKNRIFKSRGKNYNLENPIKFFIRTGETKHVPTELEFFNSSRVKAPMHLPPTCLPKWMRTMHKPKEKNESKNVLILPKTPTVAIARQQFSTPGRYRNIRPKTMSFNPVSLVPFDAPNLLPKNLPPTA